MTKMPAASSKPNHPSPDLEAQDPAKHLVGVVERKIRNLEKRKTKLESYRVLADEGKELNKDQQEAVSHYQEVQGTLVFAKDLLITFAQIITDTTKLLKKQARRDSIQRQENQLQRIRNLLLLQNVLYHMGQDHIRSDFMSGSNGAVSVTEEELNQLDEFFKIANPSREEEEDEVNRDDGAEAKDKGGKKKSFDNQLAESSDHLDRFLKEDEGEICGTTYKNLKTLIHRIHSCGYLDVLPKAPQEDPVAPPPAPEQVEDFLEEEEEAADPLPQEDEYTSSAINSNQLPVSEVSAFTTTQSDTMPHPQTQMPTVPSGDVPNAPGPIEMPPPKPAQTHDVNEVLAPVQGGFTFVQDSMLDFDSPHMDPAVVAVSQAYTSGSLQNTADSSVDRHQTSSLDASQVADSLSSAPGYGAVPSPSLPTEAYSAQPDQSVYSTQNMYNTPQSLVGAPQNDFSSQQVLNSQAGLGTQQGLVNQQSLTSQQIITTQQPLSTQPGLSVQPGLGAPSFMDQMDSQGFGSQSGLGGAQHGMSGTQQQQQSLSTSQVDKSQNVGYGATTTQNFDSDLPEFPSNPMDSQLSKQDEQSSVLQGGVSSSYQTSSHSQQAMQERNQYSASGLGSTDFGQSVGSQSLSGNQQLGSESVPSLSAQYQSTGGTASPVAINDPSQAPHSFPGDSSQQHLVGDSSAVPQVPISKSTMNAAAPPFQSTTRTSPSMQNLQDSSGEDTTGSGFHSSISQTNSALTNLSNSKPHEQKGVFVSNNVSTDAENGFQFSPYHAPGGFKSNNRGRGRGGMGSPNFRNNRGVPFIRGGPSRYQNSNMQRSNYNQQQYMGPPRDNFQQRGPDMNYGTQTFSNYSRPQDPNYYRGGRGGMPPRGNPRGGRGGNNRGQGAPYRGRGNFSKPPITA